MPNAGDDRPPLTRAERVRADHHSLIELSRRLQESAERAAERQGAVRAQAILEQLAAATLAHLCGESKSISLFIVERGEGLNFDSGPCPVGETFDLRAAVHECLERWPDAQTIEEGPCRFQKEISALIDTLVDRIEREQTQLEKLENRG